MSEGEKVEEKVDAIDPAQFAALQAQLSDYNEKVSKLEANNKALLQEKIDAKKEADKANKEKIKTSGDVEALDKSWQDKFNHEISQRDEQIKKYGVDIHRLIVGSAAMKLANEIALTGSASVLYPHLVARMSYEDKDGVPTLRVLGKNGLPSALSEEDLKKEFQVDPAFAPLMVGSKANGSGPAGNQPKGHINGAKTLTRTEFNALDHIARKDFFENKGKLIDA